MQLRRPRERQRTKGRGLWRRRRRSWNTSNDFGMR